MRPAIEMPAIKFLSIDVRTFYRGRPWRNRAKKLVGGVAGQVNHVPCRWIVSQTSSASKNDGPTPEFEFSKGLRRPTPTSTGLISRKIFSRISFSYSGRVVPRVEAARASTESRYLRRYLHPYVFSTSVLLYVPHYPRSVGFLSALTIRLSWSERLIRFWSDVVVVVWVREGRFGLGFSG